MTPENPAAFALREGQALKAAITVMNGANGHAGDSVPVPILEGEGSEPNRFPFTTASELAVRQGADVERIGPYLYAGGITDLSGPIKRAGKTTYSLACAKAIVTGSPFLDVPTKRGPVMYLSEQSRTSLFAALHRAGLAPPDSVPNLHPLEGEREPHPGDDLHILCFPDVIGQPWPEVGAAAVAHARKVGAVLMVVDGFGQFTGLKGEAENQAGAALEAVLPLQLAARAGLAVLMVRHDRKSGGELGESARGSSAFGGAVDVLARLTRADGNRPTLRKIECIGRFDDLPERVLIDHTDAGYIVVDGKADAAAQARSAILAVAPTSEADAMTTDDLREAASINRKAATDALADLTETGELVKLGSGKKGDAFHYYRPEPTP